MEYGSYDPYHFCIESVSAAGDALDESGIAAFISSHPAIDDQVDRAMRDVTLLHELRHLHDAFGTISGLTFFDAHISRLHAFVDVLTRLHTDKVRMQLPLHEWARDRSCPDYVQEFVRHIAKGLVIDAVFLGRTAPREGVGRPDQPTIDQQLGSIKFPAFPLEYGVVKAVQPDSPSLSTIAIPIGLEQLVEGNAHALQRELLSAAWSSEVEERVLMWMKTNASPTVSSGIQALAAMPYNVTDLALSRYLRLRHGITEFSRSRLTELTDRALMVGRCLPHGTKGSISLPGGAFVTLMESVDWKSNIDRPLFQEPEHDQRPMLTKLVEAMQAEPEPETYLETNRADDVIGACYSFVRHNVTLPLLKVRLEHGPAALNSLQTYLRHYAKLPVAPIAVSPDGIACGPGVTKTMLRAWTRYAMFSRLSLQIWQGSTSLTCPRASRMVAGLQFVDYNPPTSCEVEEANDRCAEWEPGDTRPVPDCHFFFLLKMFGLR